MPMTVSDVVRRMDDVTMAKFFSEIIHERDVVIAERLAEQGISSEVISIPMLSVAHSLEFLRRPAEEVFYLTGEEGSDG